MSARLTCICLMGQMVWSITLPTAVRFVADMSYVGCISSHFSSRERSAPQEKDEGEEEEEEEKERGEVGAGCLVCTIAVCVNYCILEWRLAPASRRLARQRGLGNV